MAARHPHPVVVAVLEAVTAYDANATMSRVALGRLDVDVQLRDRDGRRIVINIKEEE
jgi:hypothetical protein